MIFFKKDWIFSTNHDILYLYGNGYIPTLHFKEEKTMKKSLLSVVLCVALLITAMGTMLAMPASAASGVDYLANGTANGNADGLDFTHENGVLTFNATAAGQEVALVVETAANLNDYPFAEIAISSTGAFDLCFNDPNNNKWIAGAGDFCYIFGEGLSPSNPLPAGDYDVKFDLTGAYTWDGSALPANAAIIQVIVIAKEPGTITLTKAQITDGMVEVDLDTRDDQSDAEWDKTINLIEGDHVDAPAPSAEDPQSSVKVTKNDDGSVSYGNTAALWPSAIYNFAEPIVVNGSAALDLDFTVAPGAKTTIYIFMGPSTPDSFGDGAYVWVANPDDILNAELSVGHYSGTIFLEDTINKTIGNLDAVEKCKDEDGNYVITGVKVFAISDAATDNAVTINKLNLVALADDEPMPETTAKQDKTTTTLGQATQGADGNTTTVNNGGSQGGNSASTGDVSDAALFIVVAAAAAAVVTLSVVSKKAKSR